MINYTINSEISSDHWSHFDTLNKNVLDIGCGRWNIKIVEEFSPIFFGKTANLVVGIDCNEHDIAFYNQYTRGNSKFVFKTMTVSSVDQIKNLLKEYSINALKCDIEGAEVVLLDLTKEDLINVKEFAVEFHNDYLKQAFTKKVEEWGFNIKTKACFNATPDFMGVLFCTK